MLCNPGRRCRLWMLCQVQLFVCDLLLYTLCVCLCFALQITSWLVWHLHGVWQGALFTTWWRGRSSFVKILITGCWLTASYRYIVPLCVLDWAISSMERSWTITRDDHWFQLSKSRELMAWRWPMRILGIRCPPYWNGAPINSTSSRGNSWV